MIWDAGGIAFEMQRPTIAMDIKTNDHKSIISWQIFIEASSDPLMACLKNPFSKFATKGHFMTHEQRIIIDDREDSLLKNLRAQHVYNRGLLLFPKINHVM